MEEVDIVDKDNQIIGKATKEESHVKGLLHRTVIAEVKDKKGRWLLVKQSKSRQDAGQYVSPVGGHVRSGETTEDALKREAKEELGITDFRHKFIGKAIYNRFVLDRQENHFFILYEIYSDNKPVLNYESEDFKYFTNEELKRNLKEKPDSFGAAFHFVVKEFYNYLLK
jgi:8-oxo-dGTP pyrophosphatase MutT (NUDIX family)